MNLFVCSCLTGPPLLFVGAACGGHISGGRLHVELVLSNHASYSTLAKRTAVGRRRLQWRATVEFGGSATLQATRRLRRERQGKVRRWFGGSARRSNNYNNAKPKIKLVQKAKILIRYSSAGPPRKVKIPTLYGVKIY